MKISFSQVIKGGIALIATVVCLYLGQVLWQNYALDLPLSNALSGVEGVENVTWDNGNNMNDALIINVSLKSTENIKKTYDELINKIEQTLKSKKYVLRLVDNRSPELEQIYFDVNLDIQKAIVDGDFPLLQKKVLEKTTLAEASAKIYVDEHNIYLQITKSNSSLYSITVRNPEKIGGSY